jgi:hypothetical protein
MEAQLRLSRRPHRAPRASRPIVSERDYREAKDLLARTMRTARSTEAALRAESLLREIVDYEVRIDVEDDDEPPLVAAGEFHPMGPRRRWSDSWQD